MLDVILFQVVHQVGPVALRRRPDARSGVSRGTGPLLRGQRRPTLTCSLDVTAQKTISVKPCDGNIRKQIPPITRPSLISDSVLCFLGSEEGNPEERPVAVGPPQNQGYRKKKKQRGVRLTGRRPAV